MTTKGDLLNDQGHENFHKFINSRISLNMSGEEDIQALVVDNGELIFSNINFLNVLHIYFLQFRTMKFSITRFMEHTISFSFFPLCAIFF